MAARNHDNWLDAFLTYSSFGEAPAHMYYWVGVSTIAGALQRKVYIDQVYFRWFPNSYIILVARPGIVSKSTTANIGIDLLKRVPGIVMGPNVVTWQALVTFLAKTATTVEVAPDEFETQSAVTINSSEFGNLLDPQDRQMVDMLVSLWDGADLRKLTKGSGEDIISKPLLNIIACTTPSWISSSIPEYMLGGGLLSRCIFVFADAKERYVAYPGMAVPPNIGAMGDRLVEDLERISLLQGEFGFTSDAVAWGRQWYEGLFTGAEKTDSRLGDYVARKQTHLHKLAMVLSASRGDSLTITLDDMTNAEKALHVVETRMQEVFSSIGRSSDANAADEMVAFVTSKGRATVQEVTQRFHAKFPKLSDMEDVLRGAIKAGYFKLEEVGGRAYLVAAGKVVRGAA